MDCSYLVAHPEGRPLAVVPVTPAEKNAFRATTRGSLEPDGSAFVETSATFGGANDLFRGSFVKRTPRERRRAFEVLSCPLLYAHGHNHDDHEHQSTSNQPLSDAHISGDVRDANTGEHLPYVYVTLKNKGIGGLTDACSVAVPIFPDATPPFISASIVRTASSRLRRTIRPSVLPITSMQARLIPPSWIIITGLELCG